jgi:hypothetical protein
VVGVQTVAWEKCSRAGALRARVLLPSNFLRILELNPMCAIASLFFSHAKVNHALHSLALSNASLLGMHRLSLP